MPEYNEEYLRKLLIGKVNEQFLQTIEQTLSLEEDQYTKAEMNKLLLIIDEKRNEIANKS